jgi:hypothetical protein
MASQIIRYPNCLECKALITRPPKGSYLSLVT